MEKLIAIGICRRSGLRLNEWPGNPPESEGGCRERLIHCRRKGWVRGYSMPLCLPMAGAMVCIGFFNVQNGMDISLLLDF